MIFEEPSGVASVVLVGFAGMSQDEVMPFANAVALRLAEAGAAGDAAPADEP